MVEAHENRIRGERRPSRSGAAFEVFAAPPPGAPVLRARGSPRSASASRSLGTWPRSSAADVREAVEGACAAGPAWKALDPARRLEILARAARELALDPDPGGLLASRLGLGAHEIEPHLAPIGPALERALAEPAAPFAGPRVAGDGPILFAPAWNELVRPVASALFAELLIGRTAVLLSDAVAPMIVDAIGLALERAEAPAGAVSVVHDDGDDALRAAVDTGAAAFVRASGPPSRIRRLERMLSAAGPDRAPAADLKMLRARCTLVRSSEDPAHRAAEIVAASFGRSSSLSGQLPGRIARAVCPERSFSRFTECLLFELRRHPDVRDPVPLVDRDAEEHLRRVRVLGLDEGATLIFDGEDVLALRAAAEGGTPAAGADAIFAPTVFTNVEERMRLAPPGRPVPLLCLLRVQSDEQGSALVERLDRDVPAEDLVLDVVE